MGTYQDSTNNRLVVIPEYPEYYTEKDAHYEMRRFEMYDQRWTALKAHDLGWWLFHGDRFTHTERNSDVLLGGKPVSFDVVEWEQIAGAAALENI